MLSIETVIEIHQAARHAPIDQLLKDVVPDLHDQLGGRLAEVQQLCTNSSIAAYIDREEQVYHDATPNWIGEAFRIAGNSFHEIAIRLCWSAWQKHTHTTTHDLMNWVWSAEGVLGQVVQWHKLKSEVRQECRDAIEKWKKDDRVRFDVSSRSIYIDGRLIAEGLKPPVFFFLKFIAEARGVRISFPEAQRKVHGLYGKNYTRDVKDNIPPALAEFLDTTERGTTFLLPPRK